MTCEPEEGCWCSNYPNILPVPKSGADGCLCENCLKKRLQSQVAARQNDLLSDVSQPAPSALRAARIRFEILPNARIVEERAQC